MYVCVWVCIGVRGGGFIHPGKPQTDNRNCGFLSASAGSRLNERDGLRRVESRERERETGRGRAEQAYGLSPLDVLFVMLSDLFLNGFCHETVLAIKAAKGLSEVKSG